MASSPRSGSANTTRPSIGRQSASPREVRARAWVRAQMSTDARRQGGRARIGVLGSARLDPTDARYARAVDLGAALATAGHIVVTGGYGGIMGAVSRGASEAGGHVVGLPIRTWTELSPNEWVAEAIGADDFFARLRSLSTCDVLVALSGGVGTLAEAAVAWANLQTEPATTPALILVGRSWAGLLKAIRAQLMIDDRDVELIRLAATEAEVPLLIGELLHEDRGVRRRFG
jgi:uncharacterized protein (TIGR00725 family)